MVYALTKIIEMVTKASTLGQTDPKVCRIMVANKCIQKFKDLPGAMDLILSVGFEHKVISYDAFLIYPDPSRTPPPGWTPQALEMMQAKMDILMDTRSKLGDDKHDYLINARNAATRRQQAEKKKSAEAKERRKLSRYTAGMGGGDRNRIFDRGGT